MKAKQKRHLFKGTALLLSLSMLASTAGCGADTGRSESAAQAETGGVMSSIEETSRAEDITSESPDPSLSETVKKIDDNGKPIWDFDEYVNAGWKQANQGDEAVSVFGLHDDLVYERIDDILENTDLSSLSEEDGLYKVITLYRQLTDSGLSDQEQKTIRKRLDRISKAKSLNDLYDLYRDEELSLYNAILNIQIIEDEYGGNTAWLYPLCLTDTGTMDEQLKYTYDCVSRLEALGYSTKDATRMAQNAMNVESMVQDFYKNSAQESLYYYIYQDQLDQEGVPVPVLDILRDLHFLDEYETFLTKLPTLAFLKELYQPENLEMLRDYMLCCAADKLCSFTELNNSHKEDPKKHVRNLLINYAGDVLTSEYNKRYLDDAILEEAEKMFEDVKLCERMVISDAEWLSTHGKELAKRKVLRIRFFLCQNGHQNDLSDVTLSDISIESFLSLALSQERFRKEQIQYTDEDRTIYNKNMMETNAFYNGRLNSITVTSALLSHPFCSKDAAYEERLAVLGSILAHELSHAYDPNGSSYDDYGYNEPWMKEEEVNAYSERIEKIKNFFDGMEVDYGEKIDGSMISAETFADLVSVECCLRILEKREDPDYDLFFRTYAEKWATVHTEEEVQNRMKDTHLLEKERINYVLAQFDQFYETYDIDENSPYYVPAEKRLPVF